MANQRKSLARAVAERQDKINRLEGEAVTSRESAHNILVYYFGRAVSLDDPDRGEINDAIGNIVDAAVAEVKAMLLKAGVIKP